jgi:AcrR family transcriptional regulator
MNDDIKLPWILAGYELFSKEGPKGLIIEKIARLVNKNKSSFYHHFADIDVFTEYLLDHQLKRAKIIGTKEKLCKNIVPDLINLFLDVKQDLFFNRQLRINRYIPEFKKCIEKTEENDNSFIEIWTNSLDLNKNKKVAELYLNLIIENFYLQITEETFTFDWLVMYFNDIQEMIKEFKKINS